MELRKLIPKLKEIPRKPRKPTLKTKVFFFFF